MRILFVAPYLPSPPRFGGQRRLDGLTRGLARNHEISVLAFNKLDPYAKLSLEATQSYCRRVEVIPELDLESQGNQKRWLQARSLLSTSSYEAYLARPRSDFRTRLQSMITADRYDVIQVEFAQMGIYDVPRFGSAGPRVVLDEHNIEYDLARRSAGSTSSLSRRTYNAVNWRKLRWEERDVWRRVDGVVVTSPRDEAVIAADSSFVRTAVVPNGVDVEEFQPSDMEPDADSILFFGAINYFPNQDGILQFIDETFPRITADMPNAKLRVVGPGARKPVLSRAKQNISVTGFVDDIGIEIDKAAVVVVPLRIGGGTRLKIVEAMAKGKAVVSTRIGAEGLALEHEKNVLFGDTPAEFAHQVVRVLSDRSLAKRLGVAARELAVHKYSWNAVVQGLEGFYESLALQVPPQTPVV